MHITMETRKCFLVASLLKVYNKLSKNQKALATASVMMATRWLLVALLAVSVCFSLCTAGR